MVVFILIVVIGFLSFNEMPKKGDEKRIYNPDLPIVENGWEGNLVIDGKFVNDRIHRNMGVSDMFKWLFSRNPQRQEKRNDTFQLKVQDFNPSTMPENSIVWLGNASFLIYVNGVLVCTDPCFFNLSSG
jgi:hypothetical protein